MIELRAATVADATSIAPRLRKEDRAECLAAYGLTPEVLLPLSVNLSETWVFTVKGQPEVILGLSPVDQHPTFGIVWMMATPEILKHKREMIKRLPEVLDMLHDRYELLGNHIDARNKVHLQWLRRSGFSLLRLHPKFGVEKRPFYEFARLRPLACA